MRGGLNTYVYVDGNPISLFDLLGLKPGDPFPTPEAAAIDALNYINNKSICEDTEYGGYVYQDPATGQYSYAEPRPGSDHSGPTGSFTLPGPGVTYFHTHGAYNPIYLNEVFSPADKKLGDSMGVPTYLGTPKGAIKKYYPDPNKGGAGNTSNIGSTGACTCGK